MVIKNDNIRISILIELRKTNMTLMEVLAKTEQYRSFPSLSGCEIYLDGELDAICAKEVIA